MFWPFPFLAGSTNIYFLHCLYIYELFCCRQNIDALLIEHTYRFLSLSHDIFHTWKIDFWSYLKANIFYYNYCIFLPIKYTTFSLNRPTGPNQSLRCDVSLCVCDTFWGFLKRLFIHIFKGKKKSNQLFEKYILENLRFSNFCSEMVKNWAKLQFMHRILIYF